ncbi:MAG: hypothetical protein HY981_04345 [Candidatus Magasanikbacteria bacterium]|nr:hypothetical protein [Candidatus Magasanikbacteria bacterium]
MPAGTHIDHASVLELISAFADTWVSLDAYGHHTMKSHLRFSDLAISAYLEQKYLRGVAIAGRD